VVDKAGSWFSYEGQRIGQGRENAKQFLKQNRPVAAAIEKAIRQNAGLVADRIMGEVEPDAEGEAPPDDEGASAGGKKAARG
jgi:recombination protein RecA